MDREKMDTVMQDILREQRRSGRISKTAGVLDGMADIVRAVKVDRRYLSECVRRAVESNNPLNAFFGLFGYRVIRRDAAKVLVEAVPGSDAAQIQNQLLCLDQPAMKHAVDQIVDILDSVESEIAQNNANITGKYNDLARMLEEERRKNAQLQSAAEAQLKMAAERSQYILSMAGPDDTKSPVIEQVYEMLTDLGICVYWSAEGAPASDRTMFTEMRGGGALNGVRPCLMCGEDILVKGVRFIDTDEAAG